MEKKSFQVGVSKGLSTEQELAFAGELADLYQQEVTMVDGRTGETLGFASPTETKISHGWTPQYGANFGKIDWSRVPERPTVETV